MVLPRDLLSGNYIKPRLFLCETDKERICQLKTTNTKGAFKFNSYSELSFEVARTYNDFITGEIKVNPYYDRIEAIRLIELENMGFFEIQGPEVNGDGIKESKSITAYSLEYTLSQKYLTDFIVNTGETGSIEVTYAEDVIGDINNIKPVTLYNPANPSLSLLHLVLNHVYGWKIGHVDASLKTLSRQFEIDRESVYDFLMNEVCKKFNCYIVFDTINNTINVYAESLTAKFIGDGKTNIFTISPPFSQIGTVSVDGYKTTKWQYDLSNGMVMFEDTPEAGAHIEVIDGTLTEWETDVFVTFDNLSQEIKVNYDADAIKTRLTVTYGDEGDIREVNLGLPYLTDLSYFYTIDWMGQDLYDAYTAYVQRSNKLQSDYTINSQEIWKINDKISYEENRLSLEYSLVQSINPDTVGTYYIRRESADGSFYYKEVSLPNEYNANEKYYSNATTNVTEDKVEKLFAALQKYFSNIDDDESGWESTLNGLSEEFEFMEHQDVNLAYLSTELSKVKTNRTENSSVKNAINNFLKHIWSELGRTPLDKMYLAPYQTKKDTNIEAGWSDKKNANYGRYYPVLIFISSIENEIKRLDRKIEGYKTERDVFYKKNSEINDQLAMDSNFTEKQLIRLSAFIREDELNIEDVVETSQDDLSSSYKAKQDAMESGRIELQKLCQPQLQFSMSMANIYALPEFEPIVHQFQLGKVIKVGLRPDYTKQSRLMQVDINFDDFSDFSCEFGELTSLRTQSDIHADLLKNAISAGKSVATNSGHWSRGSDVATTIDLKIQQGLLDATTKIKAIDGSQGVVIDKSGIWLKKINSDGTTSQYQTRIVNNMILMSDDGFQTSRSALGEIVVDGETYYGLIAEMVLSGVVESSKIIGCEIDIGNGAFKVDGETGEVTMSKGNVAGYAKEDDVKQQIQEVNNIIISDIQPGMSGSIEDQTEGQDVDIKNGQLWLDTSKTPHVLNVYTDGEWRIFDQQQGRKVYSSRPQDGEYSYGDLWIVSDNEATEEYSAGTILKATFKIDSEGNETEALEWTDASPNITNTLSNIDQYFDFTTSEGLKIGQSDDKFYVQIESQNMGFHSVYETDDGAKHDVEVVQIGNNSSTIQNATFKGNEGTTFKNSATFENSSINMSKTNNSDGLVSGFVFLIEENGSFSFTPRS